MNDSFLGDLRWALIQFIVLVLCVALHEFGHAWTADKRGDPLPRAQGRVTLNPVAHIDPIGTLAIPGLMILLPVFFGGMPFALIGWGKPVQISLPNAKTRKADDILITLSGPGMNFLLALIGALALGVSWAVSGGNAPEALFQFFIIFIMMNCALGVFNLVPLPPLDGSRLLFHLVGMREETFARLARNAWWILLIAINVPPGNPVALRIFRPIVSGIAFAFFSLAEFIGDLAKLF